MSALRRPGSIHDYQPTHGKALFDKGATSRSCGKCGQFSSSGSPGSRHHRVLGYIGPCCQPKTKEPA